MLQADGCPGVRSAGDMDKKFPGASKPQKNVSAVTLGLPPLLLSSVLSDMKAVDE